MSNNTGFTQEPMLEMFLFETNQLLEQLEEILINAEELKGFSNDNVEEIFRIMHTIKGSSSMMMFSEIAKITHALEDLFQFMRDTKENVDSDKVCDFSLRTADFVKAEVSKIENGKEPDGDIKELVEEICEFLCELKSEAKNQISESKEVKEEKTKFYISPDKNESNTEKEELLNRYSIKVIYDEDCQMENVRAYTIAHNLKEACQELYHRPVELLEDENSSEYIRLNGLDLYIYTELEEKEVIKIIDEQLFIKKYEISKVDDYSEEISDILKIIDKDVGAETAESDVIEEEEREDIRSLNKSIKPNIINVNVSKLDQLMDLVGEIVITESMVTRNPDLKGLELENFDKSARQLRKLTDELQDIVMSVRMIPVASCFHRMKRIVRDMSKSLSKDVALVIEGEETEVDKNIIDNLADPLMHIVRNSMDHGIETEQERQEMGKSAKAVVKLKAENTGGEVLVTISDDGRGLNKEKIFKKAKENGIIEKEDIELSDKDIYSLVLLPGFSTKEDVSEYSGRGVGMDVAKKNIDKLGGSVSIDSVPSQGTTVSIRIPLTLAIIDGMEVAVGDAVYTIPTISIKESFKIEDEEVFKDTDGNEMIMIRGNCYSIVRLHELFNVKTKVTDVKEGIMVMVEQEEKSVVIFADELIGEQQVVVKPLPSYLVGYSVKECGVGGCTILGDGSISLILDIPKILDKRIR